MPSLSQVLRKYAEQGSAALLPAADEIVQHGHLAEYLHDFLRREPGVQFEEDPVAYRHPNGFTKIRLASLNDYGWAIRLHVWAEQASDYDIHSHRWNFASRVLSGSLTEETYALAGRETGNYSMYRCASSVNGRYSLNFQHDCDVTLVSKNSYDEGFSYERDAKTLHMAYATPASPAVTLFVQGSERDDFTTVISRPGFDTRRDIVAPRCNRPELIELLREVTDLICCD
ncbi:MAG: hypothetical protein ACRDPO_09825 [Streptosporangiaceae bacterium]